MKSGLDRKIFLGFGAGAMVLLLVAIVSYRNSEDVLDTSHWVSHTHEVMYELEQMRINAIESETGVRGFIITGNDEYLDPYDKARIALPEHLRKMKELTRDNSRQQENGKVIEDLIQQQHVHLERCIASQRQDPAAAQALIRTGESRRILKRIRDELDKATGIEHSLLVERKAASDADARSFTLVITVLIATILVVLGFVYFIIRTNLLALRRAEDEAADKNWSLTGTADLAKAMQGNRAIPDLSQAIINHIAPYVQAQAGIIYLMQERSSQLSPTAHYSASKVPLHPSKTSLNESLAGQAASEQRLLILRHISDPSFMIQTGFGAIMPQNVLAIPFIFENQVMGVVELASLHTFTERQLRFLSLIMDSVAIGINSSHARQKSADLLEETQRQSEELEAQQEELRMTNEELYAKTDLLEKSEAELKIQQEELRQTNDSLEEKADLLNAQKDILQNAKTEIESKAQLLERTGRYKSEFLANMSHELRTPLNSILILAQLLTENKNNTLGTREVEFARNIHNSGSDLLNLINEILDLSKIEAGKVQLDIGDVLLENIFNGLSSTFAELATSKGITFTIDIDEDSIPAVVSTDRQRLEQILRNLLSNAFKFTPKDGYVTLAVGTAPGANPMLAFAVTDTGIGIPREKQELIFEAFQQVDGSTKRKYGGTGLGLSISRELAHALGGGIQLESVEGEGSTFTLYLPVTFIPTDSENSEQHDVHLAPPAAPTPTKSSRRKTIVTKPSATSPSIQIEPDTQILDDRDQLNDKQWLMLILEDDEKFATILLDFLHERNHQGIIVRQGNMGISFARHYKPDAIILDMNLPVMDGAEVLRQLKRDPELRHIPVQIISSYDRDKEGLDLGAFSYIKKPVSTPQLREAFEKVELFIARKTKTLLIVEDNEEQNRAICELITDGDGDVKTIQAYSGKEAYDVLTAEAIDCIIVDLGLPDMSGFELLEKIKGHEKLGNIPVIVYTGRDLEKKDTLRLHKLADTVVLKTVNSHDRLLDEAMLFLHRPEAKLGPRQLDIIRKLHNSEDILRNKKVLLVDDDIRNIYSLTNALEDHGLICVTAENGKDALDRLEDTAGIDIVLMDVMMPEMDGYEATTAIRQKEAFRKLPILALTAKAMKGDKEKCLAVGMSDYISKPVNVDQLLALMRIWIPTER